MRFRFVIRGSRLAISSSRREADLHTTNQGRAGHTRRNKLMKTNDTPADPRNGTMVSLERAGDRRATFSIDNGIYGVGRLAKRLNALIGKDGIAAWHLAGWTDWKHTAIRIDFDSPEDARRAADTCRDDRPGADPAPDDRHGADAHASAEAAPSTNLGSDPARAERGDKGSAGIGVWEDEGGARHIQRTS